MDSTTIVAISKLKVYLVKKKKKVNPWSLNFFLKKSPSNYVCVLGTDIRVLEKFYIYTSIINMYTWKLVVNIVCVLVQNT